MSDKRTVAERISILDLVSSHVSLQKAGKYYKGLCPFHPDKNPSFVVNPERNTFHCFGCGVGGDVFSFFMQFHNVSFPQALEELARRAGVALRPRGRTKSPKEEEAHRKAQALNDRTGRFYHEYLLGDPAAGIARTYLAERGIGPETIRRFMLGFSPDAWDGLLKRLVRSGEPVELAASLGLLMPKRNGRGYYDRFRKRLMFPILDTTGQVLAFGGRALGDETPKYMNSPESFLYHKGSVLYGLSQAQEAIRERDAVLIVEGYFDLLSLHQHGLSNTVAVLGTALTGQQIDRLKRYTRNFVLIFDGDAAGRKASFRNLPAFLDKGIPARVVYLPEGEDPDSFVRAAGAASMQAHVDEAPHLLDRFVEEKTGGVGIEDPIDRKVGVLREVLPVLGHIPDRLELSFRVKALSEAMGVAELFVREELSKQRGNSSGDPPPLDRASERVSTHDWPAEERLVCQVLLQFPGLVPRLEERRALEGFRSPELRAVAERILGTWREHGEPDMTAILESGTDERISKLLALLSCKQDLTEEQAVTALDDSIRRMHRRSFKERLARLNRRIQEAERTEQTGLQSELFREKQRLLDEEKDLLR